MAESFSFDVLRKDRIDRTQQHQEGMDGITNLFDFEKSQIKLLKALQPHPDGQPRPHPQTTVATGESSPSGHRQQKWHTTIQAAENSKLTEPGPFPRTEVNPTLPTTVIVDKQKHVTHIFQRKAGGRIEEVMRTRNATGRNPAWTIEGRFTIMERRLNPTWTDPETRITYDAGPNNPLGPAAVRLADSLGNRTNLEMHGTNAPWTIGHDASHGCIRHKNEDILKMLPYLHMGTPVYITSHYDPINTLQPTDL